MSGLKEKGKEEMITALLLAAGESRRMGSNKLLLPLAGRAIIRYSLENLLASQVNQIIVVLGHDAPLLLKEIEPYLQSHPSRVSWILNEDYPQGMSTSIRKGIQTLPESCQAAIIVLADQPLIEAQVINSLIAAYQEKRGRIVAPVYQGELGHPVLFGREFFAQMEELTGDIGARQVVAGHPQALAMVAVQQKTILEDVDEANQYEVLLKRLGKQG